MSNTNRFFKSGNAFSGLLVYSGAGLLALALSGCDEIDQMADNAGKRPPVQSLTPPQIDTDPEAREHKPVAANPAPAQNPAPAPAPAAAPPADNATAAAPQNPPAEKQPVPGDSSGQKEMMTLGANTGAQGQGYGGGLITEPVHQFFSMRNLITWDQIKHDMDIWQAIHNRWPKDAQEFQKEILEPANIELPELPPGNRYVYNPKTGELLVARQAPPK